MTKVKTIAELRAAIEVGARQLDAGESRPFDETTFKRIRALGRARLQASATPASSPRRERKRRQAEA